MKRFITSAVLLFSVLFVSETLTAGSIDWEYEAARTNSEFMKDHNEHLARKFVQDLVLEDFVLMGPDGIIQGDFDAIVAKLTEEEKDLYHKSSPAQFVLQCGNMALAWKNRTVIDRDCNKKHGTSVILFQYVDGRAKVKLYHTTI